MKKNYLLQKKYKKPDISIISLDFDDIIRTSVCNPHSACTVDECTQLIL